MRTFNGYDRLSTEEELHQVLAVLSALEQSGWMLTAEESEALAADDPCSIAVEDPHDVESLAVLTAKKPELKN
jgi:hypothetical protein